MAGGSRSRGYISSCPFLFILSPSCSPPSLTARGVPHCPYARAWPFRSAKWTRSCPLARPCGLSSRKPGQTPFTATQAVQVVSRVPNPLGSKRIVMKSPGDRQIAPFKHCGEAWIGRTFRRMINSNRSRPFTSGEHL
jgi:hypothetical protein